MGMFAESPHLSIAGMKFLAQLKKHNEREWFNQRKAVFEAEVQGPWLAVIEAVNAQFAEFAPEQVRPARKVAMRIYRDIRFSPNKNPYKTHVAAWWSTTTVERTSGGGFYAHAGPEGVIVAAGVYQPTPAQLLLIRRHLQGNHAEFRTMLEGKKLRRLLPDFDGNSLKRMPKGFAADDPAGDVLMHRQWALSMKLPAEVATGPGLVGVIASRFRAVAPMVALLNAPLLAPGRKTVSMF